MPNKKFDAYISLGDNCEIGLNFHRIGYHYSSIFRFSMTPTDSLIKCLENRLSDLFVEVEPVAGNMCRCKKYGISFHTKMHSKIMDGQRVFIHPDLVSTIHKDDLLKVEYLKCKLIEDLSSSKDILYIIKSNKGIPENKLSRIRDLIVGYGGKPTILHISTNEGVNYKMDGVIFESFPRFAPYSNAHDYDKSTWDYIFSKYGLREEVFNENLALQVEL